MATSQPWETAFPARRSPDFNNLLAVLRRERPSRPTLFEFIISEDKLEALAGDVPELDARLRPMVTCIQGYRNAGYDFASAMVPDFRFVAGERQRDHSTSLNMGAVIHDRRSFEDYPWPDPAQADHAILGDVAPWLPEGMKLLVCGPCGVLENVIKLVGFDNLCYMIFDQPDLVEDVFRAVGQRLVEHYRIVAQYDTVGVCMSNDDWGFKTQTFLSVEHMERFVFPWHRRIVEAIHAAGKPATLHSCGRFDHVVDQLVNDMRFDGRHSYEDTILPVEDAYEKHHAQFAILGGIDINFLSSATPDAIFERSRKMLERSAGRGSYALGSGNSIPPSIPLINFKAMLSAALVE